MRADVPLEVGGIGEETLADVAPVGPFVGDAATTDGRLGTVE